MNTVKMMSIQDVKEQLNVSRQAILNLITSGELKAVKVGRVWRISTVAFEEYLKRIGAAELFQKGESFADGGADRRRRWKIVNTASGAELGIYYGDSADDALDAMARDAGYADYADLEGRIAGRKNLEVTEA